MKADALSWNAAAALAGSAPDPRAIGSTAAEGTRPAGKSLLGGLRRRVPTRDLLFTTMQLSIMSRAGVDFAAALESAASQSQNAALKEALIRVHADVTGGSRVSDALAKFTDVFGQTYVASVAAGEASGRLPEVLGQLAQLQRSEVRMQSTVRTLLSYPVLLSVVCLAVLVSLVLFVLPHFAKIFDDFETPLPVLTRALLAISAEIRGRYWLWLPLAAAAITVAAAAVRSPTGRRLRDRLCVRLRLLKEVTKSLICARVFRLLATMLESGVPHVEALRLVSTSVQNHLVREALARVENDLINGRGMAAGLAASEVIPKTAGEMIAMAEKTGTLAMVARLVGEYYEEDGQARLRTLIGLLEPAIVIGMGALVALVVLSVMLPMFDLVNLAQNG